MIGSVNLEIGGKERTLRFNNFSSIELAKVLYSEGETKTPDMNYIFERIVELNSKNHLLLMKTLIYAGILGHDYTVGFKASVTQEQVGEWIADLKGDDLMKIWLTFWERLRLDLGNVEKETA